MPPTGLQSWTQDIRLQRHRLRNPLQLYLREAGKHGCQRAETAREEQEDHRRRELNAKRKSRSCSDRSTRKGGVVGSCNLYPNLFMPTFELVIKIYVAESDTFRAARVSRVCLLSEEAGHGRPWSVQAWYSCGS